MSNHVQHLIFIIEVLVESTFFSQTLAFTLPVEEEAAKVWRAHLQALFPRKPAPKASRARQA